MSLFSVNNASAYAKGCPWLYCRFICKKNWTVAKTQKKGRSAPLPCTIVHCTCVDLIIIILEIKNNRQMSPLFVHYHKDLVFSHLWGIKSIVFSK